MTLHDTYLALDVDRHTPAPTPATITYELVITFDHLGATRSPEPLIISTGQSAVIDDLSLDDIFAAVIAYAEPFFPAGTVLDGDIGPVVGRLYTQNRAYASGFFVMVIREATS